MGAWSPRGHTARPCLSDQTWGHREGQASASGPGFTCPTPRPPPSSPWQADHPHSGSIPLPRVSHLPQCPTAAGSGWSEDWRAGPRGLQVCRAPGRSGRPTFTNILLPWDAGPGRVGVQYTDMDFRSRENSRVNSFCISCLMTCGAQAGQGVRGRASDPGCFLASCSTL